MRVRWDSAGKTAGGEEIVCWGVQSGSVSHVHEHLKTKETEVKTGKVEPRKLVQLKRDAIWSP
jgi:hypothetical protein